MDGRSIDLTPRPKEGQQQQQQARGRLQQRAARPPGHVSDATRRAPPPTPPPPRAASSPPTARNRPPPPVAALSSLFGSIERDQCQIQSFQGFHKSNSRSFDGHACRPSLQHRRPAAYVEVQSRRVCEHCCLAECGRPWGSGAAGVRTGMAPRPRNHPALSPARRRRRPFKHRAARTRAFTQLSPLDRQSLPEVLATLASPHNPQPTIPYPGPENTSQRGRPCSLNTNKPNY